MQSEDLNFTSYVASELKELFDQKFANYKSHLSELHKMAPSSIMKKFELTVNSYFHRLGT